jgi:hypothetical protein
MSTPSRQGAGYEKPGQSRPGRRMRNGLGVASLVLGLVAIPFSFVIVGFVFGLLAVGLGMAGRARVRYGTANNPGVALTGIICGWVAVAVAAGVVILIAVAAESPSRHSTRDCVAAANGDTAKQQKCPGAVTSTATNPARPS